MVSIIPLSVAQRRLDAGSAVQYPDGSPVGGAVQQFGDEWQQVAERYEQRMAQQQAFDAEIAARRLNGELAEAEAEAVANAPADGAGLHDAMYGQVDPRDGHVIQTGQFDTLFENFLKQAPPDVRPGLIARKEALRAAGSLRMAGQQLRRRKQYEQDQWSEVQTAELGNIAQGDPDDIVAFDASRQTGLDLLAKMDLDPQIRLQAEAAWRASTAKTRMEALIAQDPRRAVEILNGNSNRKRDSIRAQLADLPPDAIEDLAWQAREADAVRLLNARIAIDRASRNALRDIMRTGNYAGEMPGPEAFAAIYGVEEGGKRLRHLMHRIEVGRQAYGMRMMSNQEIAAKVQDAKPKPGASQQGPARYDVLAAAAAVTLEARHKDPAGYIREVFPRLDEAESTAAQQQLGLEAIEPLPNDRRAAKPPLR